MYLRSLELSGFKSFASKTVLNFDKPRQGKESQSKIQSITAVVGPNGSGKSNIADAIRWVLGEQSMKNLRGKKSEDIIFGGSDVKGKMGAASVTLTIDNSDGVLPIDHEELVLTRKVYRAADNEYLVNGMPVRLLDLQLLLAKSQFGQGSYSVVGQGMIDRLLLQSSSERKDFFDEAFGIKEFQIKRHQAVLKLSRTKENIAQAEALMNEVSPRLKTLSRQVKKLEERNEVEHSLREFQEIYFTTVWTRNNLELERIKAELRSYEADYLRAQEKLKATQEELSGLAKESSRQSVYNTLQNEHQKFYREKNVLDSVLASLNGKLHVEFGRIGKHDLGWLEKKISALQAEQSARLIELKEASEVVVHLDHELVQKKNYFNNLTTTRVELRARLSTLESALIEAKSEQNFFQLTGLRAVQAVLEEQHHFPGRVFGAVAQLAEVDEKFRLAMDVAAGAHLSSLVVSDDEVGKACINFLRARELGVATFLPLNKIKPRYLSQDIEKLKKENGVYGAATDLAGFDGRFANVFSYVFGNTLIVKDLNTARRIGIGRVRMVTLEGDVLETSGSMKGGYRKSRASALSFAQARAPSSMQSDVIDQTEKIEKIKYELDETEMIYEKTQESIRDLESNLALEKKKREFLETQKQETDRELSELKQEKSLTTMSKSDYSAVMKEIEKEKVKIENRINDLQKKLDETEIKISALNEEEEKKKQRIFTLQDAMQSEQAAQNKISEAKNSRNIAVAKLETRQEDLENEVYQELHSSMDSIKKRGLESVRESELEDLQSKIQKLKYKLSLIGGIDEEVLTEFREARERYEDLNTQLTDLQKALLDLEKLVVELDDVMKKRRSVGFKQIQKEFRRYFTMLFDGGKADLVEVYESEKEVQEESGDGGGEEDMGYEIGDMGGKKIGRGKKILTGIEVTACPPGKKIKNIAALSGGERTLTSIALICAILNSNPPPFVVLDEVEAALDEANTLRFTKILKELAEKSQFVLITHNRVTMHACDALYGVTMGSDGISHLLSVKLAEAC